MTDKKNKVRTSITIDPEVLADARRLARQQVTSLSAIIEAQLKTLLAQPEPSSEAV